jgi:predicted Zn-dependent protease
MDLLRRAQELAPDNARYTYIYAVALNSTGAHGEAAALLDRTHRQHPADRDALTVLVSIAQDRGDLAAALSQARELPSSIPEICAFASCCWIWKSAKPASLP